jgi:hypothetical protein
MKKYHNLDAEYAPSGKEVIALYSLILSLVVTVLLFGTR